MWGVVVVVELEWTRHLYIDPALQERGSVVEIDAFVLVEQGLLEELVGYWVEYDEVDIG